MVLQQEVKGRTNFIVFASKALAKAQLNYSATKRELLAVVFALQRLRQYLYGVHFVLKTDHKALSFMFTQQKLSHAVADWLDVLLDYNFTVEHCPGVLMTLPDALSDATQCQCMVLEHEWRRRSQSWLNIRTETWCSLLGNVLAKRARRSKTGKDCYRSTIQWRGVIQDAMGPKCILARNTESSAKTCQGVQTMSEVQHREKRVRSSAHDFGHIPDGACSDGLVCTP